MHRLLDHLVGGCPAFPGWGRITMVQMSRSIVSEHGLKTISSFVTNYFKCSVNNK